MNYKKNVENALANYLNKLNKKTNTRTNQKPEKEVEKSVLAWLRSNGFSVDVVESKAVWSESANRYLHSQASPGMTDIVGCHISGIGVFIELKAPKRRSNLKEHQRFFIQQKITHNAFAVCTDSTDHLGEIWFNFITEQDQQKRREILLKDLPKKLSEPDSQPERLFEPNESE